MKLARLARSAGLRLAMVHVVVFAIAVTILFWIVYWEIANHTHQQLSESIRIEAFESLRVAFPAACGEQEERTPEYPAPWGGDRLLVDEARRDGIARVAATINSRLLASGQPNLVYLLVDAEGRKLAGNLDMADLAPGWHHLRRPADGRLGPPDEDDPILSQATPLSGGGTLVVGADTHPSEELLEWIVAAFFWSGAIVVIAALAGGLALGFSMARRVEAVNLATARIIDGALGERIAVRGSGDEFDRLAVHLNRMLDRIQSLMDGLRQVSNDIAHDLRTPLTRLRQHLERTRSGRRAEADYVRAVDRAIEETDDILATFSALLRIGVPP